MTEWLHFHFSLSCIGEGNGNPLQGSCLENPRDGGAWWAATMGSHRVGHNWSDLAAAAAAAAWEYDNQYWPIHSSILAWRKPWQRSLGGHSSRVTESWTRPKRPCMLRCKIFFACGSFTPVKAERQGGPAACISGTLAVPSVQGHRLPQPQELWPY